MNHEAKIISVEIKQENGINKIFLTCEFKFGHNVQAVLYNPSGDFSVPLPDDFVTLIKIDGTGNYIAIGNLNNETGIDKGEKKIYSRDANGGVKSSIYLDKTGKLTIDTDSEIDINGGGTVTINGTTNIELNGNTKSFVTYTELNTAINLFLGLIMGHVHTGNMGAPTSTPTSPITFDISASETQTVKTGG
jgi:hypothetical protein